MPLAAVVALDASNLRPAVGEAVHLWAAWDGEWPAEIPWSGVDADTGLEASVVPRAPGPLVVRAGDQSVTLQVQPAGSGPPITVSPIALPLYDVDADQCRDGRYPALAGSWIAWCSTSGRVDRVQRIGTKEVVELSSGADAPGLGPSLVLSPPRGLWRLPSATPDPDLPRVGSDPVGPPATDGTTVALAYADHVEAFPLTERIRTHTDATPLPWYRTALAPTGGPWAAWVENGGLTGEDVWMRDPAGKRVPLARSAHSERHVAGDDHWLAWVDEGGVYVQDTARPERRAYAADTGFSGGLGMWGPVACWEDRSALRAKPDGDIDIFCSDGVAIRRPGNQMAPSRWGPWLLFREDGRTMLATMTEVVLDDDDPRALDGGTTVRGGWRGAHRDAPVTWVFDWPAEGWRLDRWVNGDWVAGEDVPVGRVTLTNAAGDAIRLRAK